MEHQHKTASPRQVGGAPRSAASGHRPGTVIVVIGTDQDDEVMARAISIARDEGRALVIIDRGAESILGNPYYDDLRSDDDFKPQPEQSFDALIARREGRNDLARHIEAAESAGLSAGGWFPSASGIDGLREAVERFDTHVLVVPDSIREPSLGERLRGVSLDDLEQLGVRIVTA